MVRGGVYWPVTRVSRPKHRPPGPDDKACIDQQRNAVRLGNGLAVEALDREPEEDWLRTALDALVAHVRATGAKRLAVERFDGEPVTESECISMLIDAGFVIGPRRAVFRP